VGDGDRKEKKKTKEKKSEKKKQQKKKAKTRMNASSTSPVVEKSFIFFSPHFSVWHRKGAN
jgi:hypothetical protein